MGWASRYWRKQVVEWRNAKLCHVRISDLQPAMIFDIHCLTHLPCVETTSNWKPVHFFVSEIIFSGCSLLSSSASIVKSDGCRYPKHQKQNNIIRPLKMCFLLSIPIILMQPTSEYGSASNASSTNIKAFYLCLTIYLLWIY